MRMALAGHEARMRAIFYSENMKRTEAYGGEILEVMHCEGVNWFEATRDVAHYWALTGTLIIVRVS